MPEEGVGEKTAAVSAEETEEKGKPEREEEVHIIADDRESRSKVLKALQSMENCRVEVKRVDAGDYVLSERCAASVKSSISDFCGSLSRGGAAAVHLFDELKRLKDAYEVPVFILNGIMSFDFNNKKSFMYRKIWKEGKFVNVKVDLHRPPASLIGAMTTIARMGIPIIRTTTEYEIAHVL
jgi:ERCC4-type nuclease